MKLFYRCDVTNREQVFELATKIKSDIGIVTILVNNAGIMPTHSILKQTENEIRKTFEVNVYAHCWVLFSNGVFTVAIYMLINLLSKLKEFSIQKCMKWMFNSFNIKVDHTITMYK